MPDYYLRRHGNVWEIGRMRYGPKHGDKTVNRRRPLARYQTQTEARQRYDRLTGAAK
ncbi:hypothetical protein [Neisseria bacilliformis]|uniref:hypothetical protein n=1 Tax=Neisseria bacilliformis TaxID=267212 RepID=UPI0028E5BB28|nr:hypothetical protein [Neisseria bacilliformis]